jgi:hypothetical protein
VAWSLLTLTRHSIGYAIKKIDELSDFYPQDTEKSCQRYREVGQQRKVKLEREDSGRHELFVTTST